MRVQRVRLPDGDDRPRQTAQLHSRRSEAPIHSFMYLWEDGGVERKCTLKVMW